MLWCCSNHMLWPSPSIERRHEPSLGRLRLCTSAPAGGQRAGDVLTMMLAGLLALDTTVAHPAGADMVAEAVQLDGVAAQVMEAKKVDANKKDVQNYV